MGVSIRMLSIQCRLVLNVGLMKLGIKLHSKLKIEQLEKISASTIYKGFEYPNNHLNTMQQMVQITL